MIEQETATVVVPPAFSARVATARNLPQERVRTLVAEATQDRFLGVLGEERVNLLKLNLALDAVK